MLFPGWIDPLEKQVVNGSPAWSTSSATVRQHREAMQAIIGRDHWPELRGGGGDGVLYVGGGKYWPGIVVGCRMLRGHGYGGPIEIWHRGPTEPVNADDVSDLDVKIVDSARMARDLGDVRILNGWESKHYALTHTTLDRVFYLDADAYAIADPTPLMDHSRGKFAFWTDLPWNDRTVKWANTWPAGSGGVPAIQGGQLFIDRAACWKQIVLSHWMNQHSDFYYKHVYGDQDTWRVAFAALPGPLLNFGRASWRHPAFVCRWGERDWVVHRCRGKLFAPEESPAGSRNVSHAPAAHLPAESEVWNLMLEQFGNRDAAQVFPEMYRRNVWGNGSGTGSIGADAQQYGWLINAIADAGGWKSATDAGCGDGRIIERLQFERYHGVDVSDECVQANRSKFRTFTFDTADFFKKRDSLVPADVLLCRDVLHHWPTAMVTDFVTWAKACGRWKWLIFTQDVHQKPENPDCFLGGYRPLHPEQEPLKSLSPTRYVQLLNKCAVIWKC